MLDLGCGLGLPGVAAASRGAHVTFSDREADALAFAEWNARRLAPPASEISSAFGDWRELRLAGRFDVILLADVSYRTDSHDALLELVGRALAPGGAVLHADPERVESSRFLRRLGARFTGAQGSRQVSLRGRQTRIRLVLAGRKGGLAGTWAAHLGWMK